METGLFFAACSSKVKDDVMATSMFKPTADVQTKVCFTSYCMTAARDPKQKNTGKYDTLKI